MHILTWNVLASEWVNPAHYPNVPPKILHPTRRYNHIMVHLAHKIQTSPPDIIALQEVMPALYTRLQTKFSEQYDITPLKPIGWGRERTHGKSGNVTMVRKDMARTDINDIAPHLDFALCLILNDNLLVANVHLEDEDAALRQEQLDQLTALSTEFPQALLLGDFNQDMQTLAQDLTVHKIQVHNKDKHTYFWPPEQNVDNILTKGLRQSSSFTPWLFPDSYYRPSQSAPKVKQLDWVGSDHYGLEWRASF